jgi:hypothetical protein
MGPVVSSYLRTTGFAKSPWFVTDFVHIFAFTVKVWKYISDRTRYTKGHTALSRFILMAHPEAVDSPSNAIGF